VTDTDEKTRTQAPDGLPLDGHLTPMITGLALGARLIARAVTRVRVEGALDEIPREGPVILAANHISNADAVILGAWLTKSLGRRIHWLGKKEMFDWPVVGYVARNGGIHPVDRGAADVDAFRTAERVLREGHVLMIFPEGTRSPTGELQRPKDGLAMLALRTGAPIVLLAIGADREWRLRSWDGFRIPKPFARVTIAYSDPIYVRAASPREAAGEAPRFQEMLRALAAGIERMP